MSRIYLYAVQRKLERDIRAERTFTSLADKIYFLAEISWEMLSNDRMSLNYRYFRIAYAASSGARYKSKRISTIGSMT